MGIYAKKIEKAQFFTDREAWNLFRLAAFGEAFGWTLLISSLIFKHYITPGNNIPVEIAGQIHGTIFLVYIAAAVILHPSMRWSFRRSLTAGLVSIPPYGTLVFEQWVAHERRQQAGKSYRQLVVRALIPRDTKLLVLQPKESALWYLPGGMSDADESAEHALQRIVKEQTHITPRIGRLAYVWEHTSAGLHHIELFFTITNASVYAHIDRRMPSQQNKNVDEIHFVLPAQAPDLQPPFLQTLASAELLPGPTDPVQFI